jgi:hypothetical protein
MENANMYVKCYFNKHEKFGVLLELVKSLNKGNNACAEDRVAVAKKQLQQLDAAWEEMMKEND